MTAQEAISLVLQAYVIGEAGETLVLDMGEPVKILDLARTLIRLSGRCTREVEITFTGLREGEKLTEQLFYDNEKVQPTTFEKIKAIRSPLMGWAQLQRYLSELRLSVSLSGAGLVRQKIKQIVPEYSPQFSNAFDEHTKQNVAYPIREQLSSPVHIDGD